MKNRKLKAVSFTVPQIEALLKAAWNWSDWPEILQQEYKDNGRALKNAVAKLERVRNGDK